MATTRDTVLLIASDTSLAGSNIADALLQHASFAWTPLRQEENNAGDRCWIASSLSNCRELVLWRTPKKLTCLDDADEECRRMLEAAPCSHSSENGIGTGNEMVRNIKDVLFLERHVAASASGQKSLTVHPIGNPREDLEPMGGVAGRLPPPSPRLASLLRSLRSVHGGQAASLEDFDVTFEATHHGPWLKSPALFAEIGSSEAEWSRADAGHCWADALWAEFSKPEPVSGPVVISIGGNHYMSHMNDLLKLHPGLMVGHMLPTYVLRDAGVEQIQASVKEALQATLLAHPEVPEIIVYMSKKSLRSAERQAVQTALESLAASLGPGSPVLRAVSTSAQLQKIIEADLAEVAV
eukprot:CAMPEP_0197713288 /NCGR_PEP_ID=MMETSP1338-20131121/130384_1 /TAXON_ID=43686 ORGANISM="Pelagodinium beii, Strain RCC1491" /NCGR_SAMPLE_ID=MMETSP1338 /ASSEMBLY_ACC=CAM_ASM_000754 /LENGTH=352 /DNA_ID=CAMNT_0043297227 /DNA_START=192 /DNA_END=1250 /DNA_ORIENTATION=+